MTITIIFWYTLGLLTGVFIGIILSFVFVKYNPGPPFHIEKIEEG